MTSFSVLRKIRPARDWSRFRTGEFAASLSHARQRSSSVPPVAHAHARCAAQRPPREPPPWPTSAKFPGERPQCTSRDTPSWQAPGLAQKATCATNGHCAIIPPRMSPPTQHHWRPPRGTRCNTPCGTPAARRQPNATPRCPPQTAPKSLVSAGMRLARDKAGENTSSVQKTPKSKHWDRFRTESCEHQPAAAINRATTSTH